MPIDLDRVRTETFLREAEWRPEAGSTNDLALHRHPEEPSLPLLIGADMQTSGRGRGKNAWWASTGSLTFSLLFQPEQFGVVPAQWPALSLTTGLAVCLALETVAPRQTVSLKWPNDVFLNGRKVCGILIETIPEAPRRLVIGIGVNANNSFTSAPPELQQISASLIDALGAPVDMTGLLIEVLTQLESALTRLGERDAGLPDDWRRRCALTGRIVTISDVVGATTGACLGIDDDAALRLQTEHGQQRFFSGVVQQID